MHESDERGVLLLNGVPYPEDALANILLLDKQNLTNSLNKVISYGVASVRPSDGALINRRMVRDEELRQKLGYPFTVPTLTGYTLAVF